MVSLINDIIEAKKAIATEGGVQGGLVLSDHEASYLNYPVRLPTDEEKAYNDFLAALLDECADNHNLCDGCPVYERCDEKTSIETLKLTESRFKEILKITIKESRYGRI